MVDKRPPPPTLTDITWSSVTVPDVYLIAIGPEGDRIEEPLGLAPLTVGSGAGCDVVLRDPKVSRSHCKVSLTEQGVLLKDTESRNGTFIGETRVREAFLQPEATARLGGSTLHLRVAGSATVVPLAASAHFGEARGETAVMRAIFKDLALMAPKPNTVLLLGETGTGKGLLARAIHENSPRKNGPFVTLDCGKESAANLDDKLFGHEKGSYTGVPGELPGVFEAAHDGTLFIDEIGELPLDLQPKFLGALEARFVTRHGSHKQRPFDARIIAATNKDLKQLVKKGLFREDLYFRIAVLVVVIPPLRDRKDDIPLLADWLLSSEKPRRSVHDLPPTALELLKSYDWPGNVRELRNILETWVALGERALAPLASTIPAPPMALLSSDAEEYLRTLSWSGAKAKLIEALARSYIPPILQIHKNNKLEAADAMDISRPTLYELMKLYKL